MAIRVMNRVWDLSQAEGGALLALLALADNASDDGYAWPSITSIAQRARLKERQTSNVLARLKADGEIDYIVGRGRGRVSVYVILVGLSDEDRREKVQGLHDKAEEIMQSLQVKRRKKAQRLRVFEEENMQSAKQKHAMPIADLSTPTAKPSLIRHENHHGIEPPQPEATATRPGGGGETVQLLREIKMSPAKRAGFTTIPPDVTARIIAACRATPHTSLAGLVAFHLEVYQETGEEFSPAPTAGNEVQAEQLRADFRALAAGQDQQRAARAASTPATPPALRQAWQSTLATLQQQLAPGEFDTWLRPARLAELTDSSATVAAPTADHATALQAKFASTLRRALGDAVGRSLQLSIIGP